MSSSIRPSQQAEEIVQQAQRQHEQLVNSAAVRQEAERQVNELREQTRQQCEQVLQSTRQQNAKLEQEMQSKLAQQEQQFAGSPSAARTGGWQRRQQLEQEALEIKRQQAEQHEANRQQALQDLETIRARVCACRRRAAMRPKAGSQRCPAVPSADAAAM